MGSGRGWIKLWRELLDSATWNSITDRQWRVATVLLLRANRIPTTLFVDGHRISIARGELLDSAGALAVWCRTTEKGVRSACDALEHIGFLKRRSCGSTRRIITIVKYGDFQDQQVEEGQQEGQHLGQQEGQHLGEHSGQQEGQHRKRNRMNKPNGLMDDRQQEGQHLGEHSGQHSGVEEGQHLGQDQRREEGKKEEEKPAGDRARGSGATVFRKGENGHKLATNPVARWLAEAAQLAAEQVGSFEVVWARDTRAVRGRLDGFGHEALIGRWKSFLADPDPFAQRNRTFTFFASRVNSYAEAAAPRRLGESWTDEDMSGPARSRTVQIKGFGS